MIVESETEENLFGAAQGEGGDGGAEVPEPAPQVNHTLDLYLRLVQHDD